MSRDYITKLKILSVFAVVSGVIYIVFKYMLPVVAPFIIALIISVLVDRPVTFLENKCHIKKKHRNACNCYCGNGIAMSVCMLWRKNTC